MKMWLVIFVSLGLLLTAPLWERTAWESTKGATMEDAMGWDGTVALAGLVGIAVLIPARVLRVGSTVRVYLIGLTLPGLLIASWVAFVYWKAALAGDVAPRGALREPTHWTVTAPQTSGWFALATGCCFIMVVVLLGHEFRTTKAGI